MRETDAPVLEAPDNTEHDVRDDDGAMNVGFVADVSEAVLLSDVTTLRGLVDDLHEADMGALI
ncbi:MAG: magnesium transporter, partial [Bosea sp. (in: a-proteobacteria)]